MKAKVIQDDTYGYLRLDPVPSKEEVDRYYAEEFYARSETNYVNDSSEDNMREEAEFHRRSYEDLYQILTRNCRAIVEEPKSFATVDVGCGYGHWLRYLADHSVPAIGIEPVPEGVEACRKAGIEAFVTPVEDLAKPPMGKRVKLVTMLNVLEHLREPARVLKDFRSNWFGDEGWVLVRVPNDFNELQMAADRLHHLDQWWVAPPRHINYFSPASLARLFSSCGYDVVDNFASFPLEMFLLMGEVYVGDGKVGKSCHRRRVAFERHMDQANLRSLRHKLYRQFAELGIGREISVLAKARPLSASERR